MSTKRHFSFTTTSIPKMALPPEPDSRAKDIVYWDDNRESPPGFGQGDVQRYWSRYLDRELHTFSRPELFDIHMTMSDKRVHHPA